VFRKAAALILAFLLMVMVVATNACGRQEEGMDGEEQAVGAQDISASLQHDGVVRTYLLHLPPAYSGEDGLPVLFVFHGGGGEGKGMARVTHVSDIADERGFIAVYPDGINNNWNDGRPEVHPGVDDVGFISALIEELKREYHIDARRVYSTGISNGGMFSLRLACELSDKIAAVAPVAALMGEVLSGACSPPRPVPVMFVMGTDDPLVPWEGGRVGTEKLDRGRALSAADSVSFWVAVDGCSETPVVTYLPDAVPGDGTRIRRETYAGGRDGSEVVMLVVEGGGHTWPGGEQYAREMVIGVTSLDIDAGEVIWDFCEGFQLQDS
jgi:polyhydroxybutyrate depolymerase